MTKYFARDVSPIEKRNACVLLMNVLKFWDVL